MTAARPFPRYEGRRDEVGTTVGFQLATVYSLMRRELEARMVEHGLTDAQWKPLYLLKTGLANTPLELARRADIDAGAITRVLDRLEAKGLVERTRSQDDRRVVHLQLTKAGEAAVAKVPRILASLNNDFLRGFTEDEWTQLRTLLGRMAERGTELQAARGSR
jgi:DNA-binding MarR family transcriptional regulator